MKLVYIAGPVTGIEKYNRPAFVEAEKIVKEKGYRPINPQYIGDSVFKRFGEIVPTWFDFMKACIPALALCDCIVMLDGWNKSRGAKWERIIAKYVFGLTVYEHIEDLPIDTNEYMA